MDKPIIYKENGSIQRNDVALTQEIANTLVKLILAGKSVNPGKGFIHIHERDKPLLNLPGYQVNAWIARRNVIPETGESLRDVLDKARIKRREIQSVMVNEEILESARGVLNKVLKMPDNLGAKNISRHYYRNKDGVMVHSSNTVFDRGVNTEIVAIKAKAAQFSLERLDSESYGRKDKVEGKHLVFSLSDLRQASQGKINEQNS